jgi:hypothetical protein
MNEGFVAVPSNRLPTYEDSRWVNFVIIVVSVVLDAVLRPKIRTMVRLNTTMQLSR